MLAIFIQYEQPSSKCEKEKLGRICLILNILAIDHWKIETMI
jgi:hypothetical protein